MVSKKSGQVHTKNKRIRQEVSQSPIQCIYEHDQSVDAEGRLEAMFEFLLGKGVLAMGDKVANKKKAKKVKK